VQSNTRFCLLTNDDGPGPLLAITRSVVAPLFKKIAVVVPDRDRIASSAALTHRKFEVRFDRLSRAWLVSSFPADAVRYALSRLFKVPPDIVISGINQGHNLGRCVVNSGTVGAAMEAARVGVPAICLSADRHAQTNNLWMCAVRGVVKQCLEAVRTARSGAFILNVNLPSMVARSEMRLVFLPVSQAAFNERYEEVRNNKTRVIHRRGDTLVEDSSIPDMKALSDGVAVVNLLATPWTTRQSELIRVLSRRFKNQDCRLPPS
jgi:5'/3'-nucleotidase SurE